uniref:Glycosyltransferase family 92 protein n=1 Tax=Panagrolaimus sp. JU765 TaxID=591449 RepID=A0AC34QV84_9BILA
MVRIDFGIFKEPFSQEIFNQGFMSVFEGTRVRPLYSDLEFSNYTSWNVFRLKLAFPANKLYPSRKIHLDSAEIYDRNFQQCNGGGEDQARRWSHRGRQIMYSVYFDETVEDTIYVFLNLNDDICEYHVQYQDLKKGTELKPHKARFHRFRGPHLTPPAGYKIVHPFMSVDSAMRTYNYLVVNLVGDLDIQMLSYRFHSNGMNKPLRWEKFDVKKYLLPAYQNQAFYGFEGKGLDYDNHTLEFLRTYDYGRQQGNQNPHMNPLMSTFDCVNFISAHYKNYEVYALAGRPARKMPIDDSKYKHRNAMFLENGHCKNSRAKL